MAWEIYIPYSLGKEPESLYTIQKGLGYTDIALDLRRQGIIKNSWFFR